MSIHPLLSLHFIQTTSAHSQTVRLAPIMSSSVYNVSSCRLCAETSLSLKFQAYAGQITQRKDLMASDLLVLGEARWLRVRACGLSRQEDCLRPPTDVLRVLTKSIQVDRTKRHICAHSRRRHRLGHSNQRSNERLRKGFEVTGPAVVRQVRRIARSDLPSAPGAPKAAGLRHLETYH